MQPLDSSGPSGSKTGPSRARNVVQATGPMNSSVQKVVPKYKAGGN